MTTHKYHHRHRHAQRGFVLVMSLVFLLLLTIIGISALGTTSLEEKMAHNAKDRNLAFQSAESAVFLGESWIAGQTDLPVFPNNSMGLYNLPPAASSPVWESVNWSGTSVVTYPNVPYGSLSVIAGGAGASLGKVQTQPKYVIEYLARVQNDSSSLAVDDPYRWRHVLRVTSRGTGGTDAAQVMTQSNFSWAFK